jgi:hypothetical protein
MSLRSLLRHGAAFVLGALAWLGGCSSTSSEGVTVGVATEGPRTPALTGGVRAFDTDRGGRVTLTRGFLSLGSVEIFACAPTAHRAWPHREWLEGGRMRSAFAHVEGSPTLLGIPAVMSLVTAEGARTKVGELRPPPGAYCRVKQTFLPADLDAPGLPPDGAMLGQTMLVEGTWAIGGGEAKPFRLTSTASFDVDTTLEATSLSVEGRRTATVVVVTVGARWFDGVDFAADAQESATRILQNLRASQGARIE